MFKCLYGKFLKIKEKFNENPVGYIAIIDCIFIAISIFLLGASLIHELYSPYSLNMEKIAFVYMGVILTMFSSMILMFLAEIFNFVKKLNKEND